MLMNTYQQGYKRQYLTKTGSFQHLFCIFIWYLIFALPFYFSFGGQNFWLKSKNEVVNCIYNFTGYYAMQVNSINSSSSFQQEYSNIVGSQINNLTITQFTVRDQKEFSHIQFSLAGFGNKQITDLNLIIYYNVWIVQLQKEISASFVQHIPGDDSYTQMTGILIYQPQSNLDDIDSQTILNYPAYLPNLKPPSSFDTLIDHILESEQVHRLNHQSVIRSASNPGASLTRTYKIRLTKDTQVNLPYYPSILQTLKFSFSTWLAFTVITYFIFYKLLSKLVKDGALVSRVRDQIVI